MSETDELRRLLDEFGVEWDYGITGSTTTRFSVNGIDLTFTPMRDGLVCSTILTPEQAVAATLGSSNCTNDCTNSERTETCRRVRGRKSYRAYGGYRIECSACGYGLADKRYRFCPSCGRKVVDE